MPTAAKFDTYKFADDERILGNPALPFVLYCGGGELGSSDSVMKIERKFAAIGCGNMSRDDVYSICRGSNATQTKALASTFSDPAFGTNNPLIAV
jgi:uncharacterized protein YjlB